MEKTTLSKDDLEVLKEKIKSYDNHFYMWVVIMAVLYYAFYYFNFSEKNSGSSSPSTILIEAALLVFFTFIIIKGYERQVKLKKNLPNQMIIKGSFKILEKQITNQKDPDSWRMNALRIFSDLENKDKFIFMDNENFRKVMVDDFIYLEYYTECDLIKVLEFNNRKLEYIRYQLYDSVNS